MENNKNKKTVKFQGDTLIFCDFIQVFVFTRNHHLKPELFLSQINLYTFSDTFFLERVLHINLINLCDIRNILDFNFIYEISKWKSNVNTEELQWLEH